MIKRKIKGISKEMRQLLRQMINQQPGTERLRVQQVIAENTAQAVIRDRFTVPDPKPDIDKILSVDRSIKVNRFEVIFDKVIVEGTVTLQIVYTAVEPSQPVHHVHVQFSFTEFVEVEGAMPGMNARVEVTIEDVNVVRDPECARDFKIAAVLEIFAKITQTRELDILVEAPAGTVAETQRIKVDNIIGESTKQVVIAEEFGKPLEKPDVDKILSVDAEVEITETRLVADKVLVEGELHLQIVYVAFEADQSVHELQQTITFSDFVEVIGAMPDQDVQVDALVESVTVEPADYPERLLVEAVLALNAVVSEMRQIDVIVSLTGPVEVTTTRLRVDSVVGEDTTQVIARDISEITLDQPDIAKVIEAKATEVKITDTSIIENKVIIRGFVEVQIMFVAAQVDQAVHVLQRRVRFRTFLEIPGAVPDNDVEVRSAVEFVNTRVENCELTIEVVLQVFAKVTDSIQLDVITGVIEVPTPEPTPTPTPTPTPPVCPPGEVIVYTVQPGDTFFTLARRFGSTVEAIQEANPGVNPRNLQVGMQIRIPCLGLG